MIDRLLGWPRELNTVAARNTRVEREAARMLAAIEAKNGYHRERTA